MHRAVPFPENHSCGTKTIGSDAAIQHVGIPYHHLRQGYAELIRGIAPEMLIGKKENLGSFRIGPAKRCARIRRCTNETATVAAERFVRWGGVRVRQRPNSVALVSGNSEALKLLPTVLHLANLGHVGHRAARVEVG